MHFLLRYKNNWIQVSIILLVECYALLANGGAHAKREACIYMNATQAKECACKQSKIEVVQMAEHVKNCEQQLEEKRLCAD